MTWRARLAGTTGVAFNRFALIFFFDTAHCNAGRNSSAHSEQAQLSFWSHRSDAATRYRIELSFAAVHESLVGTKPPNRDVRSTVAIG
jgi:hypothetical protein